ncbi:uncharacterized protein TRIVIDRAFT_228060 [Trichoderma virens Gv29-8]|uniref:Uncharacterized protein n=1 Tax=Hypocrea virens (strain Gv29-8 / FGSC 10586) TaxID=413071 RepID=G9NBC2_HYPVG|nr:uncharacterized protein TRIVIDRAFT_228060 [Trichoderma virens Gv29-8]EHK16129.1 hypothetical protein TRIVIDRAFT_228060 [Trichoderma virens Gv29-8]UKZ56092.1 hypothetical protein TrVGV298_009920 [Trichoderma virens]
MDHPSDITIDAPTQPESPYLDVILEFAQLLREKRQEKAKEKQADAGSKSYERHIQLTKRNREAVEQQIEELEARRRQLIGQENHCALKRHELWEERKKARKAQDEISKQVQKLQGKFELDECEEAKTLFREAVEDGDAAVVKLLVAATTNDDEWIQLITVSSRGDLNAAQQLLFAGVEADCRDIRFGRTALSWACAGGHKAIVQLLLDADVDVNSQDNDGWTSMQWASERGHEDLVRLMLDKGAKIGFRKTLFGHGGAITTLAFSPNSELLASASREDTIRIWDTATGQCQEILQSGKQTPLADQKMGEGDWTCSIVFTHDSKLLVSGSAEGLIRIWDITTGYCQRILQGHTWIVQSLALSHDSTLIASGSNDKTIKIWNCATGTCQRTMRGHDDCVFKVAFSHDSKLIASGAGDGHVKIWNSATGECLQTLRGGREQEVFTLAFSHDSKRIASGLNHNLIKIWDITTGKCQLKMRYRDDNVNLVAFSPDSKVVVSTSSENTIYVWDSSTGKCLRKLQGPADCNTIAFSRDFKLIASPSIGKGIKGVRTVKLWDNFVLSCVVCPSALQAAGDAGRRKLVERNK